MTHPDPEIEAGVAWLTEIFSEPMRAENERLKARVKELEVEREAAMTVDIYAHLHKRIAELEAEAASHRGIEEMVLQAKAARIAELEAEVARLTAERDRREAYQGADHVIALEDEVTRLLAALEAKS